MRISIFYSMKKIETENELDIMDIGKFEGIINKILPSGAIILFNHKGILNFTSRCRIESNDYKIGDYIIGTFKRTNNCSLFIETIVVIKKYNYLYEL